MFRNLIVFRLTTGWNYDTDTLASALANKAFSGCGATDRKAIGWVPPRHQEFVHVVGGQQLIALGVEEKILPAGVVRQYAAAKIAEVEAAQGYKPGRKQSREIREQIELELLPRALSKRSQIMVWIDPIGRTMAIEASSHAKADLVLECLKVSLGELPITLLKTRLSPGSAMTTWLATGEAPDDFSIDRESELQALADERSAVKYVRHNLDSDEVRSHIAAGKAVKKLAMTWRDRISFILTEQMVIKRVALLDVLQEDAERKAEEGNDLFDTNVALYTGELSQMLTAVIQACGGEGE